MTKSFDVFLSHNSKDKPTVRELAEALRARGLKVWLDEWELVPGQPWQEALEEVIETTGASAVLVGKDGLGPWHAAEMRGCLTEFVRRKLPVIPVLLPGAPAEPRLPLFLTQVVWVDLRSGLTEEGLDKLQWGITRKRPVRSKHPSAPTAALEAAGATKTALTEVQQASAEATPAPPEPKEPAAVAQELPTQRARRRWGAPRVLSDRVSPPQRNEERREEARGETKLRDVREPVIDGWKKAGWGAGLIAVLVLALSIFLYLARKGFEEWATQPQSVVPAVVKPSVRVRFETNAAEHFLFHQGALVALDGAGNGRIEVEENEFDQILFSIVGTPGNSGTITLTPPNTHRLEIVAHPIQIRIAQGKTRAGGNRLFRVRPI